jgi:hypothetical protein
MGGMGFYNPAEKKHYLDDERYTKLSFDVWRCDVCVFVLKDEPRVFIGGGRFGFDGVVREADLVEVEALAERFGSDELWDAASRMRSVSSTGG